MFDSLGGAARAARYAELHAHSCYSFLDGAAEPGELVAAAARLGLEALALTDHGGFPGVVRHAQAGRETGLPTIYGAELTVADDAHLPVLARGPRGYRALSALISRHNLDAGRRSDRPITLDELSALPAGQCLVLTGTVNGPLRRALGDPHDVASWDLGAALRAVDELIEAVGRDSVAVEACLDGGPQDAAVTEVLRRVARRRGLPLLATGAVRCAHPSQARLADVLTATRLVGDLESAAGSLPATGRWLRSPEDMLRLHRRAPEAVLAAAEIAEDLAFDLALVAPPLPDAQVPEGMSAAAWLAELTYRGAQQRYGSRDEDEHAWQVIDHELEVITSMDLSGYFLIVREIVDFCRSEGILCQGRGSAANSAVCYALGITAVDAVRHRMLFERFLSPGRQGYPDIDLDIEACRREEVIQHVYSRYGRHHAAQVANVISYRPRSAVRDAARALGYPPGLQDAWARETDRGWAPGRRGASPWADGPQSPPDATGRAAHGQAGSGTGLPAQVAEVAEQLLLLPRHLGVHSGGMVLTATPVTEVCPVRWAATPGRTVLQWDKDDCAAAGLVKFDLLGLGMLTALRLAFTSLSRREPSVPQLDPDSGSVRPAQVGQPWGLHTLPHEDPAVYRLLSAADTVGVFQVESRAQMATLPRLRPRTFYDIVVEVALIRPGPIQGHAVNPYIRRRLGEEPVTYLHPLLEPALAKTLGVPLFQEQLMQIAVDAAGFTPSEADSLRQAMGAKRSHARMEALHERAVEGMRSRGVSAPVAEQIFDQLKAFADFGFPESHAFSFAYLVYASAWLKVRRPEDFYAGILAAQPMGFWSPMTLVADARRHGVRVEAADVNASQVQASVEDSTEDSMKPGNEPGTAVRADPGTEPSTVSEGDEESSGSRCAAASSHARGVLAQPAAALTHLDVHPHLAVRLGLAPVRALGQGAAERIVAERERHGPYTSVADLARRVRLSRHQLEVLAVSGALRSLGVQRREALWQAAVLAGEYGRQRRARAAGAGGGGGGRTRLGLAAQASSRSSSQEEPGHDLPADPPVGTQDALRRASAGAGVQYPGGGRERGEDLVWYQPPLPGTAVGVTVPALAPMTQAELQYADIDTTGVSIGSHPMSLVRTMLEAEGVLTLASVRHEEDGRRVWVAGVVTHRQRPHTAGGTVFLNLEDETGMLNVICAAGMWRRFRRVGRRAAALRVRGRVESANGVTALLAERCEEIPGLRTVRSRDWA